MVRRCCVPDCRPSEKKVSFHEFPSDHNRRLLWIQAISRPGSSKDSPWIPSEYSIVCQKHFKKDDYTERDTRYYFGKLKRRCLKVSAIPSLFLTKSATDKTQPSNLKKKASVKVPNQKENRNMDYVRCSVPGCQSKSHRKMRRNIAEGNTLMFRVPHADGLFNKWKKALKGMDIELTRDDHICEFHFLENDIERYHTRKTLDSVSTKIKKRLPSLKPAAVPIFLKPPYSVTREALKKQFAFQNHIRNSTDKTNLAYSSCDSENCINDSQADFSDDLCVNSIGGQLSQKKTCLSYSQLTENIQLVKKPSNSWSVVCTDEFTIFARWNNKFVADKRLVIENTSTIRVFLNDWEIEMTDLVDLTTVDDISLLLEKVDGYNIDSAC